jgi:hypothetical protein
LTIALSAVAHALRFGAGLLRPPEPPRVALEDALRRFVLLFVAMLVAPLFLTTAAGCRRGAVQSTTGLQTGRVTGRRLNNLKRIVSRETGCPIQALEARELNQGIYEVVGIGCEAVRHYIMACGGRHRCRWEPVVPIEQQAVAEMQCSAELVVVQSTGDPMTRWVNACGYAVPYQLRCGQSACGWMMSGPPQASGQQVATPAGYGVQVQGQPQPAHPHHGQPVLQPQPQPAVGAPYAPH